MLAAVAVLAAIAVLPLGPSAAAGTGDWAQLRRLLHLPRLEPGARCPRTPAARKAPKVSFTLGVGPAYPVLGFQDPPPGPGGVVLLRDDVLRRGWRWHKTLWAFAPNRGPILVRGARIDRRGPLRFGIGFRIRTELRVRRTPRVWTYGVGETLLRGPGCYAFQLDTPASSRVVAFEARR